MTKKFFIIFIVCFLFCSCEKSANTNNSKFIQNRENKNDIKTALEKDPENAGTDKNQNPDDYSIKRHQGLNKSNNEYEKPKNSNDEVLKEKLEEEEKKDSKDGIINITDEVFLPLVNDIYINKDEYVGKKIRLSGQNVKFHDQDTGEEIYAILREGPGCCYNDSVIGFEYITDKNDLIPQKWYEVTAEVIIDTENNSKIVKIKLIDKKEIEPRGKVFHLGS